MNQYCNSNQDAKFRSGEMDYYFDYIGTSEHDPMIFLFVLMIKLLTNNLTTATSNCTNLNRKQHEPHHCTNWNHQPHETQRETSYVCLDARKGRLYQIIYWTIKLTIGSEAIRVTDFRISTI
jgi:hypothetical protein